MNSERLCWQLQAAGAIAGQHQLQDITVCNVFSGCASSRSPPAAATHCAGMHCAGI
jgi:hypothetical protein